MHPGLTAAVWLSNVQSSVQTNVTAVLGVVALTFGAGVLFPIFRQAGGLVAVQQLTSIPGALIFGGALLISWSRASIAMSIVFAICLLLSQIVGALTWMMSARSANRP
jgi:hypothetical protein